MYVPSMHGTGAALPVGQWWPWGQMAPSAGTVGLDTVAPAVQYQPALHRPVGRGRPVRLQCEPDVHETHCASAVLPKPL
jgi:hypothetical protein